MMLLSQARCLVLSTGIKQVNRVASWLKGCKVPPIQAGVRGQEDAVLCVSLLARLALFLLVHLWRRVGELPCQLLCMQPAAW